MSTNELTRDALQQKISRCERVGNVKYGFDLAADGVHLRVNHREQSGIRLMKRLRQGGATYREIGQALHGAGLRPKKALKWEHSCIRRILRREVA